MSSFIHRAGEIVFDILFPSFCFSCRTPLQSPYKDFSICETCLKKVPLYTSLFCSVCKARLPDNKKICHRDAPYLLGSATSYHDESVKSLIWELKYGSHPWAAHTLGIILAQYVEGLKYNFSDFVLIPTPLYPTRERSRGFNQSLLVAETVGSIVNLRVWNVVRRIKKTKSQTDVKNYEARKANVLNCFEVTRATSIEGENVIIVDDVFTSGATMDEMAKTLKQAGAKKIIGLVVAKAG